MLRSFVKRFGSVSVEDRASEGFAFDRVSVDTTSAVTPGENKLKFTGAGFAKNRNRTVAETALATVVFDLANNLGGVFFAVSLEKNFANHRVLIIVEEVANTLLRDVPVV